MDIVSISLFIAVLATVSMGIVLFKHIMFKREMLKLKEDMKTYQLKNGFDEVLWDMFISRTRLIFRFKR